MQDEKDMIRRRGGYLPTAEFLEAATCVGAILED